MSMIDDAINGGLEPDFGVPRRTLKNLPNPTPNIDDELREQILTEFKQVLKLAPADYTENCTNVVMSLIDEYVADQVAKAIKQTFIPLSQLYDQYSDECFRLGINDSPQAFFRSEKVKEYLSTTLNGVKK